MKISLQKNNGGIAVILVLVVVTLLTIFAGLFAYSMKIETHLALSSNNDERMLWMGRAGVNMASWIIVQSGNMPYHSLRQKWAGGPGEGPETNTAIMNIDMDHYTMDLPTESPGTAYISLKIVDQERLVNVNTASDQLLRQILTAQNADAGKISEVADSIQDWIDQDSSTRAAGAESDYYQGLAQPYYAKNGPLDDISELLYIKGVTPAMYDTNLEENVDTGPFQHHKMGFGHAPSEAPQYNFSLKDVFTPFSSGKINLNTASETVLELIPGMDTDSAQAIIKYRAGPDGVEGTEDDTPFINLNQLAAAGVNPQASQQMGTYATTKSTTFEVRVTAHIGQATRDFVAVLFQHGPNVDTVRFYRDSSVTGSQTIFVPPVQ